jgi:3-keto-disaccharide hydrolase
MRRLAPLALVPVLACAAPVWRPVPLDPNVTRARAGQTYAWTFDGGDAQGLVELSGNWRVEQAPSAPSPPFLLRSHGEAAALSHVVADEVSFSDADLSVRCRVLRGDGLCGLTFRVSDGAHYYAVRVDGRTRKVALYRVAGIWQRLSESTIEPPGDQWHRIEVHVRGDEERVRWDGREVLTVQDGALPPFGAVGLLADGTAGASPSEYDDLEGRAL